MVVEELQAVEHVLFLEAVDDIDDMGHAEAENAGVAARLGPQPLGLGRQFDAQAKVGGDLVVLGALDDQVDLAGDLDDEEDLISHLDRIKTEIDELLVLVAVADQAGLAALHHRDRGDQLPTCCRPPGRD